MNDRTLRRGRVRNAVALVLAASVLALALAGCGSASAGAPAASGNVQHFDVSLASGTYAPDHLTAKAGVPIQITFGQGSSCASRFVFPQLNVSGDSSGGPQTLDLGALQPGEYAWSCTMNMYHGTLTVQ